MQSRSEGNEDSYLQESLQRFIIEQRSACDELNALIGEFQAFLQESAARENLLSVLADPAVSGVRSDGVPQNATSVHELLLENTREAVARAQALRIKSQRLREAIGTNHAATSHGSPKDGHNLSKREVEVLRLMVQGKSSKEIAAALSISFKTAVTHRSSIMSKMDVHEIASVVREAIRRGWV